MITLYYRKGKRMKKGERNHENRAGQCITKKEFKFCNSRLDTKDQTVLCGTKE